MIEQNFLQELQSSKTYHILARKYTGMNTVTDTVKKCN